MNTEKEIPPPPVAPPLLWPPSGPSGQDIDLRMQNTLPPVTSSSGERVSPKPAVDKEDLVVPPPLPPPLILFEPPPSFEELFRESRNVS